MQLDNFLDVLLRDILKSLSQGHDFTQNNVTCTQKAHSSQDGRQHIKRYHCKILIRPWLDSTLIPLTTYSKTSVSVSLVWMMS